MAFVTTAQPVATTNTPTHPVASTAADASLLSMLVLTVYAANKSKKEFRRLRRKFLWTAFKLRIKSLFSRKKDLSERRIILYILLGVLALVLVFYAPIAALIVAIVGLILYLSGAI